MRTIARLAAIPVFVAGLSVAAPAEAAWDCGPGHAVANGWSFTCSGVVDPYRYQTLITCQRAANPRQYYTAVGDRRVSPSGKPSVATCGSDYFTGDRAVRFVLA